MRVGVGLPSPRVHHIDHGLGGVEQCLSLRIVRGKRADTALGVIQADVGLPSLPPPPQGAGQVSDRGGHTLCSVSRLHAVASSRSASTMRRS